MTTDELQHTEAGRTDEIAYGLDTGNHLEFIEWLEANPEKRMLEFRASDETEEVANRTTATIGEWALGGQEMGGDRRHVLEFGEAMAYVDPSESFEAIEGALAGLFACLNGAIVYNAIREGHDVESVAVTR